MRSLVWAYAIWTIISGAGSIIRYFYFLYDLLFKQNDNAERKEGNECNPANRPVSRTWVTRFSKIFFRAAVKIGLFYIWTASSEFGTYRLCEQRRFRRACASAQSRQNLRCSLIKAVSQEEPSDRKPDPCPRWMAGHAQLKFVMTECSKTQIPLAGLIWHYKTKVLKKSAL